MSDLNMIVTINEEQIPALVAAWDYHYHNELLGFGQENNKDMELIPASEFTNMEKKAKLAAYLRDQLINLRIAHQNALEDEKQKNIVNETVSSFRDGIASE